MWVWKDYILLYINIIYRNNSLDLFALSTPSWSPQMLTTMLGVATAAPQIVTAVVEQYLGQQLILSI